MREQELRFQAIIHKLRQVSGVDVPIILEDHFPEERIIGGKYSLEKHVITIYLKEVRMQCMLLFGSDEYMLNYFTVILAHELGHAADQNLRAMADLRASTSDVKRRNQISIKLEENAWNYATRLIPDLHPLLMIVKERSLDMYRLCEDEKKQFPKNIYKVR
ncbi:MAG: hypothetical protein WBV93_07680 [Anaerobacillus sp.]